LGSKQQVRITVTLIANGPPHGSVRARLRIRLLPRTFRQTFFLGAPWARINGCNRVLAWLAHDPFKDRPNFLSRFSRRYYCVVLGLQYAATRQLCRDVWPSPRAVVGLPPAPFRGAYNCPAAPRHIGTSQSSRSGYQAQLQARCVQVGPSGDVINTRADLKRTHHRNLSLFVPASESKDRLRWPFLAYLSPLFAVACQSLRLRLAHFRLVAASRAQPRYVFLLFFGLEDAIDARGRGITSPTDVSPRKSL